MTLADLCLAAISEPHVLAPLACRRKVAREGVLEPAPFERPSPDRVRTLTSPDDASRIAAGRLRGELRCLAVEALATAGARTALDGLIAATIPTHRGRT